MSEGITVDKLIAAYLKLRNKKESIEAAAKEQVKDITALMDKLEQQLLKECEEQGVDSFKTEHGTAFIKETDYASVEDWDAVLEFVEKNKAYEFLTKKVNKIPVREFIEEHKGELPPGMSYGVRRGLTVRIPATKK
jgi:predicted transcriptional regulator